MSLHIALFCTQVLRRHSGGTVRVCLDLADAMIRRGHRVSIVTDCWHGPQRDMERKPGIALHACPFSGEYAVLERLRQRLAASGPDVAVSIQSYREHLLWAVALLGSGIPFIYTEHNEPAWIENKWSRAGRLAAMSGADAIQALLPEYAESLPAFLQARVVHIPNAAPVVTADASPLRPMNHPLILCSLGRIAPVKELPLLMAAFARLAPAFPHWELHIWGEDKREMDLAGHWKSNPARAAVKLCGFAQDSLEVFRRAHLFCIPSRHEGVPLTIMEAMSCGLPVAGFADCAGVRSLVRDGENGLLARERSVEALAAILSRMMASEELRLRFGDGALKTARAYAPESIWNQWENLFRRVAAQKGHTRMDAFTEEPFASRAHLAEAARREWVLRGFGEPMPGMFTWHGRRCGQKARKLIGVLRGVKEDGYGHFC